MATPSRWAALRRALLPDQERRVGPPRTGTSRQDRLTFVFLVVVATVISLLGIGYAFWAFG